MPNFYGKQGFLSAILLMCGLLFPACAVSDRAQRPDDPLEALRFDIDSILNDSLFIPTVAAVKIVSLDSGEPIYERNSNLLMHPASNMKLLTTAAALSILGTRYEFRTTILADSVDGNGTIHGNLYLKGYGNPDLTDRDLDSLIVNLRTAGIRQATGNVVADATFFDDRYWGEGWMWDDEPYSFQAPISALSLNKNCVKVSVIPGIAHGDPVTVIVEPSTRYVSVLNTARTVTDSAIVPLQVSRLYENRLNTVAVKGEIVAGKDTVEEHVSVWRPDLYAATVFRERLSAGGISIAGYPSSGATPPSARLLTEHRWPLDTMIVKLNKDSDNLSAESVLKVISAVKGGIPASAKHGLFQLRAVLDSLGIDTTAIYVVDGSGVSHYNLVTADALVRLLIAMNENDEIFPLFSKSLPVAGSDGTLKERMHRSRAQGNLRAKTGSISGVSTLSGYVSTLDGERLAFSILMQNFILPTRQYRTAQDAIGVLLANFTRGGRRTIVDAVK